MKVSFLLSIARQVEGEYVFVQVVKAGTNPDKLFRYLRQNDLPRTTELQGMPCLIEYGIIEDVEIEED